jgi:hypothetical protein
MNTKHFVSLLFFLLISNSSIAASATPVLTPYGWGKVRIGMTEKALVRLLDIGSSREAVGINECHYLLHPRLSGIRFMIEASQLTRIDIHRNRIKTLHNTQIGDSVPAVIKRFHGRIEIEPSHYGDPEDNYLTYLTADKELGIRFETGNQKIILMYAGKTSSISYVEGCL